MYDEYSAHTCMYVCTHNWEENWGVPDGTHAACREAIIVR